MNKKLITLSVACFLFFGFSSLVNASWIHDIAEAARDAESEASALYAEKNISVGNVSFTLAQGWMAYDPEQSNNTTIYLFANDGCSISVYYQDYYSDQDHVPDETLTDSLLQSFANTVKEDKDIITEQSKDFDMLGHSGYLDYISYQDVDKVVTEVVTAFNTGKAIVNMLYYTEDPDMPFFDDYSNMISSVEIEE